jgi:hypothetical protein
MGIVSVACKPVCIHGTCNKETLKCECDEGYQGKDCGKSELSKL